MIALTPTESRWLLANYVSRGPLRCAQYLERTSDEVRDIYKALRRANPRAVWPHAKTVWLIDHAGVFTDEVLAQHLQLPLCVVTARIDLMGLAA